MTAGDRSAENVAELEAMRDDSSWHPCNVSPSLNGVGLTLNFESHEFENMVLDKEEEALSRLRFRSIPLCSDGCSNIQEGEHVLAVCKSQGKSLFCDAEVEKTLRVRHSKRTLCRCTFTIKWLHHDLNGVSVTVPSSSIMRLATKSIKEHPIISEFLSSAESLTCSTADYEDADFDLHTLLDKQITDIYNFKNASNIEISEGFLFKVEDDKTQALCKNDGISGSVSLLQAQNSRRSKGSTTRSGSKLMLDIEVKQPSPVSPAVQEEHVGNRFHLSPLGACAALASFRSKSSAPPRVDFSVSHEEKEPITPETDDVLVSESGKPSANTVENDRGKKTHRAKMKSVAPTSVRRSTRKAVLEQKGISTTGMREDPNNSNVEVSGTEVQDPQLNDDVNSNPAEERTKKRKLSSTVKTTRKSEHYVNDESNTIHDKERTDKRKLSSTVQATQKSEGKVSGTSNSSQQKKTSASSKKQELRFSPRLRSLSQTRSQDKP